MWRITKGKKTFLYGNNDNENARKAAEACPDFRPDCEDEQVAGDPVSCYNCRYRRWTRESFDCMKGVSG